MISNPYLDLEIEKQKEMERLQTLLAAAKQEEDAFRRDRAIASGIAGAADALSNVGSFGSIMLGREQPRSNIKGAIESSFGEAPTEAARLQKLIDASRGDAQGLRLKGIDRSLQVEDEKAKRAFEREMMQRKLDAEKNQTGSESGIIKDLKQNEWLAAGFAKRAEQAQQQLEALEESGFSKLSGMDTAKGYIPFVGENFQTPEAKILNQAKRNFISAVLRKESGANISPTEFSNKDKELFPQFGDTPDVLEQKKLARQQQIINLQSEGRRALPFVETAPMPSWVSKSSNQEPVVGASVAGSQLSSGSPKGTKKQGRGGIVYIKLNDGPDGVKENWGQE